MRYIIEIIAAVLVADFLSGLFHWLEDAYGHENWVITGRLITKPNILHHHDPRYFTRHGWFQSSWLLLCFGFALLASAWLLGALTWRVWLVVILGTNANQVHKWAHRTPLENGPVIAMLQRFRIVQTPRHHARHHTDPKSSHYCVLTNALNPILDGMRIWDGLEWLMRVLFGVRRRLDKSISANLRNSSRRLFPNPSTLQARSYPLPYQTPQGTPGSFHPGVPVSSSAGDGEGHRLSGFEQGL
jgi:ubiquitin-conjugating enzyme E2 variant